MSEREIPNGWGYRSSSGALLRNPELSVVLSMVESVKDEVGNFREIFKRYMATNPYQLIDERGDGGGVIYKIRLNVPPPLGLSVAARQIVSQLRGALDQALSISAQITSENKAAVSTYPVAETNQEYLSIVPQCVGVHSSLQRALTFFPATKEEGAHIWALDCLAKQGDLLEIVPAPYSRRGETCIPRRRTPCGDVGFKPIEGVSAWDYAANEMVVFTAPEGGPEPIIHRVHAFSFSNLDDSILYTEKWVRGDIGYLLECFRVQVLNEISNIDGNTYSIVRQNL